MGVSILQIGVGGVHDIAQIGITGAGITCPQHWFCRASLDRNAILYYV